MENAFLVSLLVNVQNKIAPRVAVEFHVGSAVLSTRRPLQANGCKLSVLFTFSYVKEKRAIFSAFSSMRLFGISCQQIINNNFMKYV